MIGLPNMGEDVNSSDLDCLDIIRKLQSNGFCLDFDVSSFKVGKIVDSDKDSNLRSWFDEILLVFLKGFSSSEVIRPLPAMLGDGRSLDLFKLFWVVRGKGGSESVSKYGLWGSVAQESGLSSEVASPVKLLYMKYLDTFDLWVQRFCREKGIKGIGEGLELGDCGGKLGSLLVESDKEFRAFLSKMIEPKKVTEEPVKMGSDENKLLVSDVRNNVKESNNDHGDDNSMVLDTVPLNTIKKCVNEDEDVSAAKLVDKNKDVVMLDPKTVDKEIFDRKRKREALSGLLKWLKETAKDPGRSDKLAKASKRKGNVDVDFCGSFLLARNALYQGGLGHGSTASPSPQKKQKMHPIMYEDQSLENRCSPRLLAQKALQLHSSSKSCGTIPTNVEMDHGKHLLGKPCSATPTPDKNKIDPFDDARVMYVRIGPLRQAEVPECTGVAYESDPKWLGTQHWPVITNELNSLIDVESIGRGRRASCGCLLPGSVACVRFHIAETRLRLKLELGKAFYSWKFQFMGEEVSLSWTKEEEKKFKELVKSFPSSPECCFWKLASRRFPTKERKSLLSYYFNVFVLRRRCLQNRVTPTKISSDNEDVDDR